MNSRVASLPDQPTTVALADAVAQIGRLAAGMTPASPPVIEPVPGWLADRLVHTAGMNPAEVASLSLEQAQVGERGPPLAAGCRLLVAPRSGGAYARLRDQS